MSNETRILEAVKKDYCRGLDSDNYRFEYRLGKGRYHKIVAVYKLQESASAAGFYDTVTGSIFRAASWSAPARTRIA